MTGIACQISISSSSTLRRIVHRPRCFSGSPEKKTPTVLKLAVGGVTELLRLFSVASPSSSSIPTNKDRSEFEITTARDVDDVIEILRSDYGNAYFVTGIFTSAVYSDDCIFEDPTISFKGIELYERNLKLLVPFLEDASIELESIEKSESSSQRNYILATWKLRTYLKLPWRPSISINGNTVYELDRDFKIMKHVESWNVSAVEAIRQIFTSRG